MDTNTRLDELGEDELFRRAADGQRDAWGVLVRRCLRRSLAAAQAILRNRADAADAVQDALVHALRKPKRDAPFQRWFTAIVRNAAIDLLRKRRRAPVLLGELPERSHEPDASVGLDIEAAQAALHGLDEPRRRAMRLWLAGHSTAAMAGMLGVPAGTAGRRVCEAKQRLRQRFQAYRAGKGNGRTCSSQSASGS